MLPSAIRPVRGAFTANWLLNTRPILETPQLRRLSAWGVPGICTSTLLHQIEGLPWKIVNADGEADDVSKYYSNILTYANDGRGGASTFFMRLASDILACKTGGFVEVVRASSGVPVALYNVDGETMRLTYDTAVPYAQQFGGQDFAFFTLEDILHLTWRPFVDWELEGFNLSPVQIAYNGIFMLASGDDYNRRLMGDEVPSGILNLGSNFDQRTALEWKSVWDAEMASDSRINKFGILWGTDKIDFHPFAVSPKDMAFSETEFWYAVLVCASFELSPLDIGIAISRVTTGAAAEQQSGIAKRQGLTALLRKIVEGIERHILPEDYHLKFEQADSADRRDRAAVAQMQAQAIGSLVESLGPEAGLSLALEMGLITNKNNVDAAIKWVTEKAQMQVKLQQMKFQNQGKDQTAQDSRPNSNKNS